MFKNQNQLIEALTQNNLLSQQAVFDLKNKAEVTKKSPEEIVLTEKLVNEEKLTEIKAKLLNIPCVDLRGVQIDRKIL